MNLFKRIRNLWDLSRYKTSDKPEMKVNGDPVLVLEEDIPIGDGKAEFLGEGSQQEWEEQQKEDKGLKGIFGL